MSGEATKMRKIYAKVETENGPTREYFWAEPVSDDTVKVANIPFFSDEVAYEDVVRVTEAGEVLEVLERSTRTRRAVYEAALAREDAEREYQAICNHLRPSGIECESARAGMFSMAVPLGISDNRLREVCSQCPVPLRLLLPDPVIRGFCTTTRITAFEAVVAILKNYQKVTVEVLGDETSPGGTLTFPTAEHWPSALKYRKYGLPEEQETDSDAAEDASDDLLEKYGDQDFLELLQELAPYLETGLTLQVVSYSSDNTPIEACEWHVQPGNKEVEVNEFKHSQDAETTA
jgi:hypothetical protein